MINGRFLSGARTAVNVVALELSKAIYEASLSDSSGWRVELAIPPSLEDEAVKLGLPLRVVGKRSGILWEQLDLPRVRGDGVILSLFNTVPIYGRGYVTMLHDAHVFTSPESYPKATRIWRAFLSRCAGRRGNYLLAPSDYSMRSLLHEGIGTHDAFQVVPNGPANVSNAVPDVRVFARIGLNRAEPYCVGLSSLLPHKNIGVLLRAFSDPALAGVELVLFGKTTKEEFLEAGFTVPNNVRFAGFVSDEELAALYDGALAVCVPSLEEGFGLPALEGMARGAVPVIAPCGALPEVVGDAGLQASATSPDAHAQQILKLIKSSELVAELSRNGRERAKLFTWRSSGELTLKTLSRWFH